MVEVAAAEAVDTMAIIVAKHPCRLEATVARLHTPWAMEGAMPLVVEEVVVVVGMLNRTTVEVAAAAAEAEGGVEGVPAG